jgi:integrase
VAAVLDADVPSHEGTRIVAELLRLWQKLNVDRWAPLTGVNQQSRARLVASGPLGRIKVGALRVEDVDRWMLGLRKDGTGHVGIRNQLQVRRAALNQAVTWDWIDHVAALARPLSAPADARSGMPDEAVSAVIAAAPHQAAALPFRISAVTGARRAELAALRWEDVVGDKLSITGQVGATPRPRGAGPPVLERRPTKTRQSAR